MSLKGTSETAEVRLEDMDKPALINLATRLNSLNFELIRDNTVLSRNLQLHDIAADELRQTVAKLQSQITTDHLLTEDISQLKVVIAELEKQNEQLKEENALLKIKLQTYEVRLTDTEVRLTDIEVRVKDIDGRVKDIDGRVKDIDGRVKDIDGRVKDIEVRVTDTEVQLTDIQDRLKDIDGRLLAIEKSKVSPLSIREAMRVLERWLCFEAVGKSKNQFKKFYNFDKISKDVAVQSSLNAVLANAHLNADHVSLLSYLKDLGDYDHVCTVDAWYALFSPISDHSEDSALDEEDIKENILKADLLNSLMSFLPSDQSGEVRLVDPVWRSPSLSPLLHCQKLPLELPKLFHF